MRQFYHFILIGDNFGIFAQNNVPFGCGPLTNNLYYDSNNDGVFQPGSDQFIAVAGGLFFNVANVLNPSILNLNFGEHTIFYEDCEGVVSVTFRIVEIPTVEFNNQPGDLFCAIGTSVNLLDLLSPNSTMGGTFSLISSPGGAAIINGNTLDLDIDGDYTIRYTINDPFQCSANDDFDLTINIVQSPIAEFNNPVEEILCTTITNVNLLNFLAPGSTSGGTFTLTTNPGGGLINGNYLEFGVDGSYGINYEVTDQFGCTANEDLTINYSLRPSPLFSLSRIGGCVTEDVIINATRTTNDPAGFTPSWTVTGANFSGGTGMNSTDVEVTLPVPAGDGVAVNVEICLTESTPNCDTEICKVLSFYNDGQDCDILCNGPFFDPCVIDVQPGIVVGCSFFEIETPALVTICSSGEDLEGNALVNALQDNGTINCDGASISCGEDGFVFTSEIKLFGLNSDVGSDDTIGDIIGNGLCGVLSFFGIIEDCDATIAQFIVNILSRLAGGDGAGSLLVADTDGDGQFDTVLGDEQNLPVEYTEIFIPNNIEGVGSLTVRSIGSFPNPPAGSCGNIQDGVNLLDLLAPIIDLIPVAGPIINAVIANAGCGADIAVSASDDFVICVENDQPPFFVNCPTTPYMFSQDYSCNIKANWSTPVAADLCTGQVLRFQGIIDTDGDGIAENDPAVISSPGVWQTAGPIPGSYLVPGVYEITYTARGCETTTDCTFEVIITSGNPILTCPNDMTLINDVDQCTAVVTGLTPLQGIGCNTIINYEIVFPASSGLPTVTTNSAVVGTHNDPSGTTFPLGTSTITYTMQIDINGDGDYDDTVDGYDETQMCSFTITIIDGQNPVAACIDIEAFLDEDGEVVVYAANPNDGSTFIDGGSTDNCGIASIMISKPGGAYAASVTFDCDELGTNFVNLQVIDESGNISNCIAQVTVRHFLSNYNLELDLAEICLGDNSLTQLDFSEYLTITDELGNFIDPNALPAELRGTWSITNSNMFPNSFPGTIDPTTGQYTIGTGNGNVLVQYSLALATGNNPGDITACSHDTESIFELYQPLDMGIPTCYCADDAVKSYRVVDLGIVEGGLPPYTIQFEGAGLDVDEDGTPDALFNLGEYTYDYNLDPASFFSIDLGQLIVNEGETNWSITVLDSRGCEIHRQGQCEPLLDVPSFIGANSPACFTDGSYSLSLSNDFDITADYVDANAENGNIIISKLIDSQVSDYQINNTELCGNFPYFNADVNLVNVFIRDAANDRIIVNPEALIGLDYRYAGTYRITLIIPPSEETQCQYIEVSEEITLYPSFDPCFAMPLELCGNALPVRIDVNEYNPGYDDLATNLLCRDLDEMSVWEIIAPNGIVVGTGTVTELFQENDTNADGDIIIEGLADGDVIIDPAVLYATFGPGNYTLNHEIGIDICKTSCTFSFDILDFPVPTTLIVDAITGGTTPYTYDWSFVDATMTPVAISPSFTSNDGATDEFMLPVNNLPGGCPMFDSNPNSATQDRVYSFILTVVDAKGCKNLDTVLVAINPNPDIEPEVFNAIYCQTNKAEGEAPIKNIAYSTSTLRVNCGESFDNVDANGNGFIDFGTCSDLAVVGNSDGDGIPDIADADLNLPDADGDGVPDSADKDLLCIDEDKDCIPDIADMDIKTTSLDTDCDGIPDAADTDFDNDGILDATWDIDLDGIPNTADVDADGDGLIDANDDDADNIPNACDADDNPLNNTTTPGGLDSDFDGVPDVCDIDDDNDGINDAADIDDLTPNATTVVAGCVITYDAGGLDAAHDIDLDGIENPADINSFPLGTADEDADGIANVADSDVDGDCICNTADVEFNFADTDGDGWPDNFDADIDNDGILDIDGDHDLDGLADIADADHPNNVGELDTDLDNIIDPFDLDDDNDGVLDTCDSAPLNNAIATILAACDCNDTDMDSIYDSYDLDDDNDGILDEADASHPYNVGKPNADADDIIDAFDVDANGDQVADSADVDSDGDQINDECDTDDDNDGILDEGDADAGGDGIVDFNKVDSDGDGLEDSCDTDDDADQIIDTCDADIDGDNELDCLFPFTDLDGNGVNDYGDPDGDGIYTGTIAGKTTTCDLDSDNDGIVDYADADINGDGHIDNGPDPDLDGVNDDCDRDDDGDGIVDECDADHPSNAVASDFDGDGQIDDCDCDDDNDSVVDECDYLIGGMQIIDTDMDGILDPIDADSPVVQADQDGDGIADFADADVDGDGLPNTVDADFGGSDNDEDGINDAGDADDDNDGILDDCDHNPLVPFTNTDADNDEIKQSQDADQNCDGIIDNGTDDNGDGVVDTCTSGDLDGDGIVDAVFLAEDNNKDGIIDGIITPDDLDSDGVLNICDVDDDNDGINNTCDIDSNPGAMDSDGDGIIDACDQLVYPVPTVKWYASETSDTPLFDADADKDGVFESDADGDPSSFDPVAGGLVDPNEPGIYTFWVECVCVPTMKCVGPRVPVTLTILDCQADEGCTYLLVLEDLGADGWDGASIDVSINEQAPTNYKITPADCDLLIIPITANDGGLIDLEYWNGAKENEHRWRLIDPLGNVAIDESGDKVDFKPFNQPTEKVRVKLDCPVVCDETVEYYVVNTIGTSAAAQIWELRDAAGELVAFNIFGDYAGLAPGTEVIDTVQLNSCEDYNFVTFDGAGSVWNNAKWQIIGSDADRGTYIADENATFFGYYEIISGPISSIDSEQICKFTIPCKPEDCPDDFVAVTNNTIDCELGAFVHPTPPTPFVCYPNCEHAHAPEPMTTISYPELLINKVAVNTPVNLPVGDNPVVFEITYGDGMIVRCSSIVSVVTDNNPALTCNDNVNISLADTELYNNDDCYAVVSPDDLLENPLPCLDQYRVIIFDLEGNRLVPVNVVGPEQAGLTLTYKIEHIGDPENHCWGTLNVEDKLAPIVECYPYDIECTHPELFNENYTHQESYLAIELPANLAGDAGSNIETTIDVGCTPLGEIVQNVTINVNTNHNRLSDLSLQITSPSGIAVTTSIPANPLDLLIFNGTPFNSHTGEWDVIITDNNGAVINDDFGGLGSVLEIELLIQAGFPQPALVADCSPVTFEVIQEELYDTDCNQGEWLGAKLLRTWQAVDAFGNSSTCIQEVGLKAPTHHQIIIPEDLHLECGDVPSDPAEITPEISEGPYFGCYPLTGIEHTLCDISYTYEDQVLPSCGNGFKITRTWTITNWCTGISHNYEQKIKVEDTKGPEIDIDNIVLGTSAYDCATGNIFISPAVTDACSDIQSVKVTYTLYGGIYDETGDLVIQDITNGESIDDLPFGVTEFLVFAQDICGNTTEKIIEINVTDSSEPIAICNDELHVSLGGDGEAWLYAEDVDEGSYDNCGEITLEVRRTDGCLGETPWADSVPFECCDVDELVTVELRVTDASGNSNICWKTVLVEDALPPVITCPDDKTINCDDPAVHAPFGEAIATDNCSAEISYVDAGELDNCKAGTLTRTFTATDGSDKSVDAVCIQRVTVEHVSDFVVQFPADVTLSDCQLEDTGEPVVTDDDCELIAISSEDVRFDIVDDACYKIERTWTLINWCVYTQGAPATDLGFPLPVPRTYRDDDGYFTYVQTIKVLDNDGPVIDCPGDQDFCDLTDGCEGFAELILSATDACSPEEALEYEYKIDAFNDGSFDIVASGNDASGVYPYGTHLIKWVVEDGCGNTSVCSYLFTVRDCKNPTPLCINGVSIPGMNSDGCVEIWANDLLDKAWDNCTEDAFVEASVKIRKEGTSDALQDALTLCCDDLGTVIVEIWVSDDADGNGIPYTAGDNTDFCSTYIILQDNSEICGGGAGSVAIAGDIETEMEEDIEDVMVNVEGGNISNALPTSGAGSFVFPGLSDNTDYMITPEKNQYPLNGVTTFDLVLMTKHILGVSAFDSPYKMIAADINRDGKVTTSDVIEGRKLILYIITDFTNNTSWRFVDAAYEFPQPANPWFEAFPENVEYSTLMSNEMSTDFIGVKIGDVNNNAVANSLLGAKERNTVGDLVFAVEDETLEAGKLYTVDFRAKDFNEIIGYQFTLNFDVSAMEFAGIEAGELAVSAGNFGLKMLNEGVITTSFDYSAGKTVNEEAVLFSIDFTATSNVKLSEAVKVTSRYTNAEAYNSDLDLMDLAIEFSSEDGTIITGGNFELYQNRPNPFSHATVIGFNLPEASTATMKIYDVSGRILKVIEGDFSRGYNEVSIEKGDLNNSGVLYYQIDTPTNTDTKKMLMID